MPTGPDPTPASPLRRVCARPAGDHPRLRRRLGGADGRAGHRRLDEGGDVIGGLPAYVALPGGLGTLEELAEVATRAQMGLHDRAIGFLDVGGSYDGLFAFFDRAVSEGFVRQGMRDQLLLAGTVDGLLALLEAHEPRVEPKWIAP